MAQISTDGKCSTFAVHLRKPNNAVWLRDYSRVSSLRRRRSPRDCAACPDRVPLIVFPPDCVTLCQTTISPLAQRPCFSPASANKDVIVSAKASLVALRFKNLHQALLASPTLKMRLHAEVSSIKGMFGSKWVKPGQIRPAHGHACPLQSILAGFKSLPTYQPPLSGVNCLRRFLSRRWDGSAIRTQLNGKCEWHKVFLIQGQNERVRPVLMLYHHHAGRPSECYYAVWCECQLTRASCSTQTAAVVGRTPDNVSFYVNQFFAHLALWLVYSIHLVTDHSPDWLLHISSFEVGGRCQEPIGWCTSCLVRETCPTTATCSLAAATAAVSLHSL